MPKINNSLGLPALSRREFLRTTGQLGLAAMVLPPDSGRTQEEASGIEYAAAEVTLPFAYSVNHSQNPKPQGLDFSHQYGRDNCQVFVRIDGELWEFRSQWIVNLGTTARYKGPDIDHLVRVEDGIYPDGMTACWFLGGMWYDEPERRLYAPMHVEQDGSRRDYPGCRKIALATSTDKGRTWRYEGDIITSETYYYSPDFFKFSGSSYGNGVADFGFYADVRGGYFYVFPDEGWNLRGNDGMRWNARAARCAIGDKMAPGKWNYFYNGGWNQSALGGKSSTVAPSHLWGIVYSADLEKYICLFLSNQDPPNQHNIDGVYIGCCSDLGKQDWVWGYCPDAMFGFFSLLNSQGTDVARVCDDGFRFYSYWNATDFQRLDFKLSRGRTVTTSVHCRYLFEPHPESSDPILGRKTKIVGSGHPDVKYAGTWIERSDPESYEGKTKKSATIGSSVELSFEGTAVYWRGLRSPESGRADVYLDGVLRKTVDCYSPRSTSCEQFMFFNTSLSAGMRHTIRVVVTGEKHANSADATINHIAFEYSAESYRVSAGFSGLMGKNHWYYQQLSNGSNRDLIFLSDPAHPKLYWFGEGNCQIGTDYQIPGVNAAVRKWIAPHHGHIRIEGTANWNEEAQDAIIVSIWLNAQQLWPPDNTRLMRPASHDLQTSVVEGDSLSFVVARTNSSQTNADSEVNKVTWNPVITFAESLAEAWQANLPGPQNVAQGKYARSKFLVSSYQPFNAVDGDLNTAFIIHADDPISSGDDWLEVDLEKTYNIDKFVVVSQTQLPAYRLSTFRLQQSDDGFLWTDVDEVGKDNEEPSTVECIPLITISREVRPFRSRYVRLYLPKGKPFAINQFALYYTGKSAG